MRRYKNIFWGAIALLLMIPSALLAQSYGSINTYSPYSIYGLGELSTPGTIFTRSMGGAGVAMRSPADINLLNPASYSASLHRSVLFNYGMEASNYFNTQMMNGKKVYNSYASGNIHDIALQFPLAKNAGAGLSITPYSSAGYVISTEEQMTDIGLISYVYEGGGDITEVKFSVGAEIFENFSVGAAALYYWGRIDRSFTMTPYVVTGNGSYYSATGETSYVVSRIKAQLGAQWSAIRNTQRNLTLGATYDFGGSLHATHTDGVYGYGSLLTITSNDYEGTLPLALPSQLTAGATYQTPKLIMSLDYTYQDWSSSNSDIVESSASGLEVEYNDFSTVKMGVQWTPNRNDVRSYFKRVSYRGGLRYGGYQQTFSGEEITQFAATAGACFPLKMGGISKIDVGLEYGSRGSSSILIDTKSTVGLIRQNYFKIALGFTLFGEDYWFQRPKFD